MDEFSSSMLRKIFKYLIGVPVLIYVSFFVLNLFAFGFNYFRLQGASYNIQQSVMDNNYLTSADIQKFNKYLDTFENSFLSNVEVVINTNPDTSSSPTRANTPVASETSSHNERKQYGSVVDIGIISEFHFKVPLLANEMTQGEDGVNGMSGTKTGVMLSGSEITSKRNSKIGGGRIDIINRVVGLQYYSDLDN